MKQTIIFNGKKTLWIVIHYKVLIICQYILHILHHLHKYIKLTMTDVGKCVKSDI